MGEALARVGRLSLAKQKLLQQKLKEAAAPRLPPLGPSPLRRTSRRLPCSFSQQRLWFLHQLEPLAPAYNLPAALRLDGPLAPAALAAALVEVVRRHEVLRSTYEEGEEGPLQVASPPSAVRVPLPMIDLRGLPKARRGGERARRLDEAARRPFDLARGPVLRAALLRAGEREHAFLLSLHHIAADGWSLEVLVRETAALYGACCRGEPSPLPELPIQYADFADWQRRWLRGEVLAAQVGYWRRRLAGAPAWLALPTDRPRPEALSSRGASRSFALPAALVESLAALTLRRGATLFATLVTAFQVLLCRWSGEQDVSVGTPVAGRRYRETEELVGCFVNTLVVRTDLSGNPAFGVLLGQVREALLDDQAKQDVPLEKLVDELEVERSLARTPLFQAMLAFHNAPEPALAAGELSLGPLAADTGTAKFELTLAIAGGALGLGGGLEYSTDLFDAATAGWLLDAYERLLREVAADPERPIWDLPLMAPGERDHLRAARPAQRQDRGGGRLPLPPPDSQPPQRRRRGTAASFAAPASPAERALAQIWSQVLQVEEVGAGDNFFALGGDSILSIRVRSLAARSGLRLELQDFFRHQTLAALAAAARREAEPAAAARSAGPLYGIQARSWRLSPARRTWTATACCGSPKSRVTWPSGSRSSPAACKYPSRASPMPSRIPGGDHSFSVSHAPAPPAAAQMRQGREGQAHDEERQAERRESRDLRQCLRIEADRSAVRRPIRVPAESPPGATRASCATMAAGTMGCPASASAMASRSVASPIGLHMPIQRARLGSRGSHTGSPCGRSRAGTWRWA